MRKALTTLIILSLFSFMAPTVNAQSTGGPQLMVTWQALNSYVPPAYQGKTLPGVNSQIIAEVSLISQGKMVGLSNQTIYWYLNNNYIGGGTGAQTITFSPIGAAPDALALEVKLPSYNNTLLIHTVDIPVAQPKVVIVTPFPLDQFTENPLSLQAEEYFFNATSTDSLAFAWSANGQPATNQENPSKLQINLPSVFSSGSTISVSLTVQNPLDSIGAEASANLTYQNLP